MIAADTSSLIAFLAGERASDTDLVAEALRTRTLYLPPPVATELSAGASDRRAELLISRAPMLSLDSSFWVRAGANRRVVRSQGLKANFADTLIAQCCIDANVALIARDGDFRHFATHCGLKLAL